MTTKWNLSKQFHIPKSLAVPFLLFSLGLGITAYNGRQTAWADCSGENDQEAMVSDCQQCAISESVQLTEDTNDRVASASSSANSASVVTESQPTSKSQSVTNQSESGSPIVTMKVSGVNLVPKATSTSVNSTSQLSAASSKTASEADSSNSQPTLMPLAVSSSSELDDSEDSSETTTSNDSVRTFNEDGDETSASLRPIEPVKESDRGHHEEHLNFTDRVEHLIRHVVKWIKNVIKWVGQIFK